MIAIIVEGILAGRKRGCLLFVFLFFCIRVYADEQRSVFRIKAGGDIDYPPFTFNDDFGNPSGFDVDVIRRIAEIIGAEPEIELGAWDQVLESLVDGQIDVIIGILYSESRSRYYDFTTPYNADPISMFVNKKSEISGMEDLQNKDYAILSGDAVSEFFVRSNGLNVRIIGYPTFSEAFIAIDKGIHDFTLCPYSVGMEIIEKNCFRNIKVAGPVINTMQYRLAVRKGNDALFEKLEYAIEKLRSNGELKLLKKKWTRFNRAEFNLRDMLKYLIYMFVPLALILVFLWIYTLTREIRKQKDKILIYHDELVRLANTDPLTGIINRRKFFENARNEFMIN